MAKNKPQWIIVHHTAVSYSKNADQFEATKRYHISKGWGDIGYHYEISKLGKIYKGRKENKVGAHTSQQKMNYRSIGIVLDGNFDIELPSDAQKRALKALLKKMMGKYKIPLNKVVLHRYYATYKSCAGTKLGNDWAQKLISEDFDTKFAAKWEGRFILDVDDKGKVYYVSNGKRLYVNPRWNMRKFVIENGLQEGFKHSDIIKIEQSN